MIPPCPCGAPAIAVDPGETPEIDMITDIMVRRGRTMKRRCLGHWSALKGWQLEMEFGNAAIVPQVGG